MLIRHSIFEGSATAVVMPMNGYGNLDFGAFGKLSEWVIRGGVDAVVVNGTTGESVTLDDEEKMAVIRYAVGQVDGRIPVIAGTGGSYTEHAVELSRKAQELGTDALLQVTPYYDKASQDGPVRHFTQMAGHVDIPILLYNVPSRTGVAIQPGTYKILSEHPNIRGAKGTSGNLSLIAKTVALCGEGFDIYSGNDDQTVSIVSLGDKGVVSVPTSIMPREIHQMCRLYLGEDMKESRRMQLKLLEVMETLFWDINPIPVKATLCMIGVCGDDLRLLLTSMEPGRKERLAGVMKWQGISLKRELYNQTNPL